MSVDLNIINKRVTQMAQDLGRGVLHQIYPNDFEYYMLALELVDGANNTIDYFVFPVMPSAIVKSENKRINVKKAYKSTLVLTSTAFVPQDITIRGNFGRSFKILVGTKEALKGVAFSFSTKSGVYELAQLPNQVLQMPVHQFHSSIKTGYGAIKILQAIIHKSDGSDQQGPYRLYLYNFALGESYLVVAPPKALVFEQNDAQTNMIWNYTLNLTIIAPLEQIRSSLLPSSNQRLLESSVIQSTINRVGKDITGYLSQVARRV